MNQVIENLQEVRSLMERKLLVSEKIRKLNNALHGFPPTGPDDFRVIEIGKQRCILRNIEKLLKELSGKGLNTAFTKETLEELK